MSMRAARLRPIPTIAIVGALLAFVAGGVWLYFKSIEKPAKPQANMIAVLEANNIGVAHMEQYQYGNAIQAFEKVVDMAPDWTPGQINLGIALLNEQGTAEAKAKAEGKVLTVAGETDVERAKTLFRKILDESRNNPAIKDNHYDLYAHFCLGIMLRHEGSELEEATDHFKAVTVGDPDDAGGWIWYSGMLQALLRYEEALIPIQKARQLAPYNRTAIYYLQQNLLHLGRDPDVQKELLNLMDDLDRHHADSISDTKYGKMGHYADVIGKPPLNDKVQTGPIPLFQKQNKFHVELAPNSRWATSSDLGDGPIADLRRAVRERFGACMVTLDYDGDGKPDLFLIGAVVEDGKVRDLLLRNDGDYRFTDVTRQAGLADSWPSLGCCVGDIDNDGKPDLIITGAGKHKVFRNKGNDEFEDATSKTGLDKLTTVCFSAVLVDLDQDSDLDLVLMQYADTVENALKGLKSDAAPQGPGIVVFFNKSAAPVAKKGEKSDGLILRFERDEATTKQLSIGPKAAIGCAVGDFDKDRDLDLLFLADRADPVIAVNDRLLRYRAMAVPESLAGNRLWNGALVVDANHDNWSDLFLIGPGQKPVLLMNRRSVDRSAVDKWFESGVMNSPPLLQAHVVDVDLDSWPDIIGLSEKKIPVLLHNDGKRLVYEENGLGSDLAWPKDLVAVLAVDLDDDCFTDLIVWSEKDGLQLHSNQGNGNHGLFVDLSGKRDVGLEMRCNADALGTWIVAQSSDLWSGQELTTLSAGLGQSRQPLILGLGKYSKADVLRLRWPDGILQAELEVPACQRQSLVEVRRETISCPILFAWNGNRFIYITDFLGAGALGEYGPDRSIRPPRGAESVKIEAEQLVPKDGQYVLKIAQPMDEATYIDRLQLVVLDHPADRSVYPDERFVDAEPYASQALFALKAPIFPEKARDHRGKDVTETLRQWDRQTVDDFAHRAWLGYAEDHWVELDFGDRLANYGPKDRLILCMAGWTDYPYPESIWAATQAGVALQAPLLERLGEDGKWRSLGESGFPAGLPRMMTYEITGKLTGPRCVIRLRSNMQVYWDQIFVAPLDEVIAAKPLEQYSATGTSARKVRGIELDVHKATLSAHSCMQTYTPDGKKPLLYDYDRPQAVPVTRLAGKMTRFGEVTELLRQEDDCFVIFGPGEELEVRFDASKLPELPAGWKRSFVLKTSGYCKDCAPFTATGETIEPLPSKGMKNYPYGPEQQYPADEKHQDYLKTYNTRHVGSGK
ncbi:MAG: FG-GAP-like repeat-containing protein [Gemmataceae bacterium]